MSFSARTGSVLWSISPDFDLYTTSKRVLTREGTGGLPDESLISNWIAIKISSENHLDDERNKNAFCKRSSDHSFFSIRNKRNSNTVVLWLLFKISFRMQ